MKKIKELCKIVYSWFSSDDEWHDLYDRGSLNGGQGAKVEEEPIVEVISIDVGDVGMEITENGVRLKADTIQILGHVIEEEEE